MSQKQPEGRLEFLYKVEKANTEEFLLGKKIERVEHLNTYDAVKQANASVMSHEVTVRPLREEDSAATMAGGGTLTMAEIEAQRINMDRLAKMRDDPLFIIKKREEDERRELLRNPVKMKPMQEMLQLQPSMKAKARQSEALLQPKLEAEEDDGDNLLSKYLSILKQKNKEQSALAEKMLAEKSSRDKHSRHRRRSGESTSSESDEESDALVQQYMKALQAKQQIVDHMDQEKKQGGEKGQHGGQANQRQPQQQRHHEAGPSNSYRRGDSPPKRFDNRDRERQHYRQDRSRSPQSRRRSRSRSREGRRDERRNFGQKPQNTGRRSPGTLERLRREMEEAAMEHKKQRETNVSRYKEEDQRELELEQQRRLEGKSTSFLTTAMSEHADRSSVSDRIQRNRHNIQRRGRSELDGGPSFVKR